MSKTKTKPETPPVDAPAPSMSPRRLRRRRWMLGGLILLTLAAWHNTLLVPFHQTDASDVVYNEEVRSLSNVGSFISGFYDQGLLRFGYALNYTLSPKTPDRVPQPGLFHFVNLLLHLGSVVLVYLLTREFLRRVRPESRDRHLLWALLSAGTYGVLPIHTTTVNLIAERGYLQGGFFALLALYWGFVAADPEMEHTERLKRIIGAAVAFVCALGSHYTAVAAAPLLVLMLRYAWPAETAQRQRKALAAIGGAGLLGLLLLGLAGEFTSPESPGLWRHLLTQPYAAVRYAFQALIPFGLAPEPDVTPVASLFEVRLLVPLLLNAAGVAAGVWLFRRRHPAGLALLWFYVALAPSMLLPHGEVFSEPRVYLAAAGLVGAVICGLAGLVRLATHRPEIVQAGTTAALAGVVPILLGVTLHRNWVFAEDLRLWLNNFQVVEHSAPARLNLAVAQLRGGHVSGAIRALRMLLEHEELKSLQPPETMTPQQRRLEAEIRTRLGQALRAEALSDNDADMAQLGEALTHLDRALKLQPDNPLAQGFLAEVRSDLGLHKQALKGFPEALANLQYRARFLNSWGEALAALGRHEEAIERFEASLKIGGGKALSDALMDLEQAAVAVVQKRQRRKQKARQEAIEKARAEGRKPPEPEKEDEDEDRDGPVEKQRAANKAYVATLKMAPLAGETWGNLGRSLLALERLDAAADALKRALQIDRQRIETLLAHALVLEAKGDWQNAGDHYRQVLIRDSSQKEAALGQARTMVVKGRLKDAAKTLERYDVPVSQAKLLQDVAQRLWKLERIPAARRYARAAAITNMRTRPPDPELAWSHYRYGQQLSTDDKHSQALQHLRLASKHMTGEPKLYYHLALALQRTGGPEKLIEQHYRKAAELDPEWARPWVSLGAWQASRNQHEQAETALQKALKLNPDSAAAHHHLGALYLHRQDKAEALKHLKRALELDPERKKTQELLQAAEK